jgi:hypothetical protein
MMRERVSIARKLIGLGSVAALKSNASSRNHDAEAAGPPTSQKRSSSSRCSPGRGTRILYRERAMRCAEMTPCSFGSYAKCVVRTTGTAAAIRPAFACFDVRTQDLLHGRRRSIRRTSGGTFAVGAR